MKRRHIESALCRAVNDLPAPDYRAVHDAPVQRMAVHDAVTRQASPSPALRYRRLAAAATALGLLILAVGVTCYLQFFQIYSVVELSINPSFAIELSRQDKIRAIAANNADAQVFLEGRSYQNWTLEATVTAILQELSGQGRIGDTIGVEVTSKDLDHGRMLREQVLELVSAYATEPAPPVPESNPSTPPEVTPAPEGSPSIPPEVTPAPTQQPVSTPAPAPSAVPEVPGSDAGASPPAVILTPDQVFVLIRAREPDAQFKQIELDEDNSPPLYEVQFQAGDKEYEAEVDAFTGEMLRWDHDD